MPTITQQLRADRHRRTRRRRALAVLLVAVPAAVLGVRLAADAVAEVASDALTQRSPSTVSTPLAPVATSTTAGAPASGTSASTTASSPSGSPAGMPASGLAPGLVRALERARTAAADAGHELTLTSGYRTRAEQAALLEEEADERGSLAEAMWWVFPPDRSMHVQGLAADVGDRDAAEWLDDHGARFGLCRTLRWEWWHFEWREAWEASRTCPPPARSPEEAWTRDAG